MNGFAGTWPLARLALRRDRIMLLAWAYVITAGVAGTGYAFKTIYPTQAQRTLLAAAGGTNPALVFLYSKLYGDSVGALTAWRYGVWATIFAALMSIFVVVRHTRADEETGRLELIGSTVVGRQAPLSAAVAVAGLGNLVIAVLVSVALIVVGLPSAGSVAIALAIAIGGVAFACIAALAAQIAGGARAARGIALGVVGAAYLLRAVGDSASSRLLSRLSWLSPLGWSELVRPFAGQRWWVLAMPAGLALVAGSAAYALATRRDHGTGMLPDRPGRPQASALLSGVFGLAWRLQGSALAGWAASLLFIGLIFGAAGKGIGSVLDSSSQLRNVFTRLGDQAAITNAYLAAIVTLAGLVVAAYAVSAVLRLRSDETSGLAEPVLATAVDRFRWGLSHVMIAVTGAATLLASAGLAIGLGYGLRAGDAGTEVPKLLSAALAQLPASLAVAGVAIALFGVIPQACVGGGWAAVAASLLVLLFGPLLRFPQWIMDISPFTHVPKLPGGALHVAPLVWLSLAAMVLAAAGLSAFRLRDVS
jgi:ABC-2 type transport system permease protein